MSVEDLKIKEITKLVSEGKVSINELIKSLSESIVPVLAKKTRKQYLRNGKPKMTEEERREYQKQYQKQYQKHYYEKNKEKLKERHEENKEILNKNQKKYYRIRALCKELSSAKPNKGNMDAKITPMTGTPLRELRKQIAGDKLVEESN